MDNFCGTCGSALSADKTFCGHCGAPVKQASFREGTQSDPEAVRPDSEIPVNPLPNQTPTFATVVVPKGAQSSRWRWAFVGVGLLVAMLVGGSVFYGIRLHQKEQSAAALTGTFEMTDVGTDRDGPRYGTLKIGRKSGNTVTFDLEPVLVISPGDLRGGNQLQGEVEIRNGRAVYSYDHGKYDKCKLTMAFLPDQVKLEQEEGCGFGAGVVSSSGTYVRATETSKTFPPTVSPVATPEAPVTTEDAKDALVLRSYIGRLPDKAFWVKFGGVFRGILLLSNYWSEAFQSFLFDLDQYLFTPCQYDPATNTVTVTWRSVSKMDVHDMGSVGDIGAVSLDVNDLGGGIVASWDGNTQLSFYYVGPKILSQQDASSITKGDFQVLPPALAEWATALIKRSEKTVEISALHSFS